MNLSAKSLFIALAVALAIGVCSSYVSAERSVHELIHHSREAVSNGELHDALEHAEAALRIDPAYFESWKQKGRVLMLLGSPEEALRHLERAAQLNDRDPETRAWILQLLATLDRPVDVVAHLDALPDDVARKLDPKIMLSILETLARSPAEEHASSFARQWVKNMPDTQARNAALALERVLRGETGGVESLLNGQAESASEPMKLFQALVWRKLGERQMTEGAPRQAVSSFKRALELEPGRLSALRELGWAYRSADEPELAAETWEAGYGKEPKPAWLIWIAEALIDAERFASALEATDRFLEARPDSERGRALRLFLLMVQKKQTDLALYEQQLRSEAGGERAIAFGRALYERHAGRFEKAVEGLERLFGKDPQDPEIRKILIHSYVRWAEGVGTEIPGARTEGRPRFDKRDSLYPLRRITELEPSNRQAWQDLGWALWAAERKDEALEGWGKALEGEAPDKDRLIFLVTAELIEAGQTEKALEFYGQWHPDETPLSVGLELVRRGRLLAAAPVIEREWERGNKSADSGLYLALVRSKQGECRDISDHLDLFLEAGLRTASTEKKTALFDVLRNCAAYPWMGALLEKVDSAMEKPDPFDDELAWLLLDRAFVANAAGAREFAWSMFERVLGRNPDNVQAWIWYIELGHQLRKESRVDEVPGKILPLAHSTVARQAVKGILAEKAGDLDSAAMHYSESVQAAPDLPELRIRLFDALIHLGRLAEARQQARWFEDRFSGGDSGVASHLAQIRMTLGDREGSLEIWQSLLERHPGSQFYLGQTASALFSVCRGEDALALLENNLSSESPPRNLELLGDIYAALGRPEKILELTGPDREIVSTPTLLRKRAEAADMLGESSVAAQIARALLERDPGNESMNLLLGRSMLAEGLVTNAKLHYESLVNRNEQLLPALLKLREIASFQGAPKEAGAYAGLMVKQRPWDTRAKTLHAVSLAEAGEFRPALEILREQAGQVWYESVPIILYRGLSSCPYPGLTTSGQFVSHLERLKAEGYAFIGPDRLNDVTDHLRVMIVLVDPETSALEELDAQLRRLDAKVVAALSDKALQGTSPVGPGIETLERLSASGRWIRASSGPPVLRSIVIDEAGNSGNPLTHRRFVGGEHEYEDDGKMAARLNDLLSDASLGENASAEVTVFVYPQGDYGQLSLDTDAGNADILRSTVGKNFDFAVAYDDSGFVQQTYDPLRLPARQVRPGWHAEDLMNHLKEANPSTGGALQLAKVLYWQRQHERADRWFQIAGELGANPLEIHLHRGLNAYQARDIPSAATHLGLAHELDARSDRTVSAMRKLETYMRPSFDLNIRGWEDSDDRNYQSYGGHFRDYVSAGVRLGVFADRHRWARTGLGSEKGTRTGIEGRWHFVEGRWLDAEIWNMDLDGPDDHLGGDVSLHWPTPRLGGFFEISAGREEIHTVEAVREEILARRLSVLTYSRFGDLWDTFANLSYTHRSDQNNTYMLEGRIVRRIKEWPFLGAGYAFRFGDSDEDPFEYWAPEGLQQHQLYLAARGEIGGFHGSVSARTGFADEEDTDWRFVSGIQAEITYAVTSQLKVTGEIGRLETPDYDLTLWGVSIGGKF